MFSPPSCFRDNRSLFNGTTRYFAILAWKAKKVSTIVRAISFQQVLPLNTNPRTIGTIFWSCDWLHSTKKKTLKSRRNKKTSVNSTIIILKLNTHTFYGWLSKVTFRNHLCSYGVRNRFLMDDIWVNDPGISGEKKLRVLAMGVEPTTFW